jgi:ribonuclease BN (tRNA processing enzyme)
MEYLEGGTLEQACKSFHFSEKQIAYVAKEVTPHALPLIHISRCYKELHTCMQRI